MNDDSTPPAENGRRDSSEPRQDEPRTKAPLTPEEKEKRWADATEVGRQAGLKCTGVPGESGCSNPACIIVVIGTRMFGLPCREHTNPLVAAILKAGHAAVRTEPLIDHVANPHFLKSARYIREQNFETGVRIPPGNPHSTSKKAKRNGKKSR